MIDRAALHAALHALPSGSAISLPVASLLELLEPAQPRDLAKNGPEVDLTPDEVGAALRRSPVTVRGYCSPGLFEGAYRMRGRQWRIPRQALETFQAAERKAHARREAGT